MDINKKIEALGIVPVVVLNDADDAVPLCKALAEGGLPVGRSPSAPLLRRSPSAASPRSCPTCSSVPAPC